MASLASLPSEVKHEILIQLPQGDLLSLCGTCKDIYESTVPILYSNIVLPHDAEGTETDLPILALLRTLLDKAVYAMYIREIEFRAMTHGANNLQFGKRGKSRIQSSKKGCNVRQLLRKVVDELPFPHREHWYEAMINNKDPDAMIAIVFARCINLESLMIDVPFLSENIQWLPMVFRHAVASQDKEARSVSLDHLVHFRVINSRGYGSFDRLSGESFLFPFYMPKITTLYLSWAPSQRQKNRYDWTTRKHMRFSWPLPESPITNSLTILHLVKSSANADTIQFLLKQTPNLRSLVYDCYLPTSDNCMDLSILRQALWYVRNTLTNLSFKFRYMADEALDPESLVNLLWGSLAPLRDFTVLKSLEISPTTLYGQIEPEDLVPLADVLPPALTRLILNGDLLHYDSFLSWEGEPLTGLYKIFISGDWRIATPHIQELQLGRLAIRWADDGSTDDESMGQTPNVHQELRQLCERQGLKWIIKY